MRIVSVVGARPQFVKLAPVSRALMNPAVSGDINVQDIILHTGQHYDKSLSDIFFDELDIPKPAIHLDVGSASHGAQTARMLEGIEAALLEQSPDMVVIYGDTNSTVAGGLAAVKLHIPVAHVEAGLRSFDRTMPEEINRVVADHISSLLLAPTETAMQNLERENLVERACLTGDVMLDAVRFNAAIAEDRSTILSELDIENGEYAVATLHRAANTEPETLQVVLSALNDIADEKLPVIFPVHPRTVGIMREHLPKWQHASRLRLIEPVGYLDMLKLLNHARIALTDSGGLQKEALFLGTPCVTLRDETEWPETVTAGGNVLAGADRERILAVTSDRLDDSEPVDFTAAGAGFFGDGLAATRIATRILEFAQVDTM